MICEWVHTIHTITHISTYSNTYTCTIHNNSNKIRGGQVSINMKINVLGISWKHSHHTGSIPNLDGN